ncbi:hypothetical protein OROGR_015346 [Orobanche gracilis]
MNIMAVEVTDSNFAIIENGSEAHILLDNEKVNITFGSHGVDEPVNVEVNNVSETNGPSNAVDDWPEAKQIHSFFIVRYRAMEDQIMRAKLDVAEKELHQKNQARLQIVEKIKAKRTDRAQIIAQIRSLSVENKQFRFILDEKRKEIEPLQQALGKLRGSGGGERGSSICSSEEELNYLIKSLQHRIQHESIHLNEEKQILREIKQLEGTRPKVIAHASEMARIQDSMGEKAVIQGQVKLIGVDLDGVRKDKQVVNAKLKQLDEEKMAVEKEIGVLEEELMGVTEKRDKTFESIKDLRKQRDEGNSPFYQNRMLLMKARALAANNDVDALKELAETEVDNFMYLWNSNKVIRDDYEKRISSFLDTRQLSKDDRLRTPNEKPLIGTPTTSVTDVVAVKTNVKHIIKEDVVVPSKDEEQKVQKSNGTKNNEEGNNKKKEKNLGKVEQADEEEYFSTDKLKENSLLPKKDEVDVEKLKELKREEEIVKRREAEERKKKQAEKASAKAAIKAQKEAEKKLKEIIISSCYNYLQKLPLRFI